MKSVPTGAVLVPTDMSAVSIPAAIYATDLAQRIGAPVVLFHVIPPRAIEDSVAEGRYADTYLDDLRGSLLWWFATFVPGTVRGNIGATAMVAVGHPEHEIVTTARAIKPRMIVMGTHGRSGLARAALGSVAEAVLRHAPCPVLTVPAALQDLAVAAPAGGGRATTAVHDNPSS